MRTRGEEGASSALALLMALGALVGASAPPWMPVVRVLYPHIVPAEGGDECGDERGQNGERFEPKHVASNGMGGGEVLH
jgi:hypothetical protein